MKIYKDILPDNVCNDIYKTMSAPEFPWFYLPHSVVEQQDNCLYFHHTFYNEYKPNSNYIQMFEPLFDIIDVASLMRVRGNLTIAREKPMYSGWHSDFGTYENEKMYTGILYLNDNNGYTEFEDGTKAMGIRNTFVEFPHLTKHRGVYQTDSDIRLIVNFNYFKGSND